MKRKKFNYKSFRAIIIRLFSVYVYKHSCTHTHGEEEGETHMHSAQLPNMSCLQFKVLAVLCFPFNADVFVRARLGVCMLSPKCLRTNIRI